MQVKIDKLSPTKLKLTVIVDDATLKLAKEHAVKKLSKDVKVAGFRPGKAPANLVEKAIDQNQLHSEFIDEVLNHAYTDVIRENDVRPVLPPQVSLTKFVPYSSLEFTAEVEVLGKVKLADYKNMKLSPPKAVVSDAEVTKVIENMRLQMAEKTEVDRKAKNGDEAWIDFDGKDEKGQPVKGASGKDYPLNLGSNTFIPGFEDEIVGLKAGDEKTFKIIFPKDYGAKALQNKKVTFAVKVTKIKEVKLPELNDEFVKKVSPVKTVKELKDDVKGQLLIEKQRQVDNDFEAEVINTVTNKSEVDLPEGLLKEQADAVLEELKRNITYRGLTFQEYLEDAGLSEEEQRTKEILPEAERRLKAGLVLSEIADAERVTVSDMELEARLTKLKEQYKSDPAMQAELEKPESKRDIAARLMTEKSIMTLVGIVSK